MSGPRSTVRWQRVRAEVLRDADPQCPRCGRWLDFDGPRGPSTPTVDHITPLARGGDPFARENLRVLCACCNSKLGGGLRRATPRPGASRYIRKGKPVKDMRVNSSMGASPKPPEPPATRSVLVPVCDGRACVCEWFGGDAEKCDKFSARTMVMVDVPEGAS